MANKEDKFKTSRYRPVEHSAGGGTDEAAPRPRKRGGTRRRRRMGVVGALIYIAFVIGISTLLATVGWIFASDVLALNKEYKTAVIEISEGEEFSSVVDELLENGIVEHGWVFRLFCMFSDAKSKITTGSYTLNTEMDYRAIINNLGSSSASRTQISVTIPEGYTIDQVFSLLEEKGVSTTEKLQDMAANHDYNFSFLKELELGDYKRLEGYLFPDTYNFYVGENALYVINKMLVNFDAKVTDDMRQTISQMGYSVHDIVIIASMIERETDGTDRATISSVIYNRLNSSTAFLNYLQIDATIAYVTGRTVTLADREIDSPYNTFIYPGLPAGPIANPGMESIWAAINPESTQYYWYALGSDGLHHFYSDYNAFTRFLNSLSEDAG